jgi:hypothetical protein
MEDGMKKQVLWKQVLWKVVVFGAALLTASGAIGQAHQNDAITEIPFAFAVASQTLPAGRYTVTRMNDTLLRISNSHNESVIVLTTKVESKAREDMINAVGEVVGLALQNATGEIHGFLATPRNGQPDAESATSAVVGQISETPKIVLPESVRKMLRERLARLYPYRSEFSPAQ